jgi:predicted dithiol-disulfide oxidoreductase (DUF899 family)
VKQGNKKSRGVKDNPSEKEYRGIDLLTPVWNLLDLTPAGREEWMPSLEQE